MTAEASGIDRAPGVGQRPIAYGAKAAAVLRLLGFILAAAAVELHAAALGPQHGPAELAAAALVTYGLGAAAARVFLRSSRLARAIRFLDAVPLALAVAATGGPSSWLLFLLLLPPAAAAIDRERHPMVLAVFCSAAYGSVLVATTAPSLAWPAAAKFLFLTAGNLYLALLGANGARSRMRMMAAIRAAGQRIRAIEESSARLTEEKQRAQEVSQAKSDFLAMMSHDVRTPLNGIIGMSAIVLGSRLDEEQRRCIESIRSSAEWLKHVADGILDLSQIEGRSLELSPVAFDLFARVREVMKPQGIIAFEKGLELCCSFDPDVPRNVIADDARIREVLDNLIGNGIRYTEQGEVALSVSVDSRTMHEAMLHFTVSDTGRGIPPESLERIFEAYVRLEPDSGPGRRGVGLGLNIALRLARLMGGDLRAENREEGGARFHFTVRVWLQRLVTAAERPSVPDGIPRRALVVDDRATSRSVLVALLQEWGFEVMSAGNGAGAERLLRDFTIGGREIPVVLIDALLGDEDGFTLAERLRRSSAERAIIVLLPSVGDLAGAARCRRLGVGQATKPVMAAELAAAISQSLNGGGPGELYPGRDERWLPRHAHSLRALVVDDDSVSQAVAAGLLQAWGHAVQVVPDARTGIEIASRGEADLILMDEELVDGSGTAIVQEIRRNEQGKIRAGIIGLTGHASAAVRERLLRAGADMVLTKPIDEFELFDAVESVAERGHEPAKTPEIGDAITQAGGSIPLARKITRLFIQEVPAALALIDDAIVSHDAPRLAQLSHKLKGSVSNFASAEAVLAAEELERAAKAGDLESAATLAQALRTRIGTLERALRPLVDPEYRTMGNEGSHEM